MYIPQLGKDGQVVGAVALISDVSERKAFERFRAAAAARAERLLKVTAALADAVTTAEVFEAVVDQVAAATNAASVTLWLVDKDNRTLGLARSVGFDEATRQRFAAVPLDAVPSIPALDAIRRGEPLWISSQEAMLRDYPHLKDAIRLTRPYRVACLPLWSQGGPVGVLAITSEESREVTEDERSFLLLVARYASQAIQRLRLLEDERQSRADADAAAGRLALLNHASRSFGGADLDLEVRLRSVAAELGTALDSSINVAIIEPDGFLHLAAVHHPSPEATEELRIVSRVSPLPIGEGITGSIAASGKSVLIPTLDPEVAAREAPSPYRSLLSRHPVYALMGAPLLAGGRIIGTVTAARCRPNQSFTTDDLKLLEELGERAAAAIENARLHREAVNARSRAEQLYRFAQAVVAADRVEVVFDAALTAIKTAVGATRAAILISDADGVMRFRAWRHLSDRYRQAVEGHSPWPRDAVAPQPVLVSDVEADASMKPFLPLFRDEGIGSLAFIPLVTRGQLIGTFMLYYGEAHVFSEQEIELASAIAHHLASVTARFAAFAKLEETIRYNDLFAGVLAHDLRNPLGAMMTAAQILLMRNEGAPDLNAKPISRILSSGQRMVRMIDQLLDLTRARAGGGIEIQPRDTNLGDLCNQAIDEIELAFPEWTIRREIVGELDGAWDSDRLLQIVSNLVSNAGQHGQPAGALTVTARRAGIGHRPPKGPQRRRHPCVAAPQPLRPIPRHSSETGRLARPRPRPLHRQGDHAGARGHGRGFLVARERNDLCRAVAAAGTPVCRLRFRVALTQPASKKHSFPATQPAKSRCTPSPYSAYPSDDPMGALGKVRDRDFEDEAGDLLALLVEQVVDYAIFVIDKDGMIASWNPGAQRIKGYAADEIIGTAILSILQRGRSRSRANRPRSSLMPECTAGLKRRAGASARTAPVSGHPSVVTALHDRSRRVQRVRQNHARSDRAPAGRGIGPRRCRGARGAAAG